jgi:hypothetical protein
VIIAVEFVVSDAAPRRQPRMEQCPDKQEAPRLPRRTGKEIQNDGTNLHFPEYPREKDHKKNPHRPDRNKNVQTA